jgi:hypothetical protein
MGEKGKREKRDWVTEPVGRQTSAKMIEFKWAEKAWSNKRDASIGKSSCIKGPTKIAAGILGPRRRFLSLVKKKAAETCISAACGGK